VTPHPDGDGRAVLLVVGIAASIVAVPANVLAAAWFLDEASTAGCR
jgi:hypothetical protein